VEVDLKVHLQLQILAEEEVLEAHLVDLER
jgi:hypothetical protein